MTDTLQCLDVDTARCALVPSSTAPPPTAPMASPSLGARRTSRRVWSRLRAYLELMSPTPAPWFDESYAGERWL